MSREAKAFYRLTDKEFQLALAQLHLGHIPENMTSVFCHIRGTVKELMEYTIAITECAIRLNNDLEVMRDILDKSGVKYEKGPDGPYVTIKEDYK